MEVSETLILVNAALNVPLAFTTTIGNAFILTAIWKTPSLHTATNALLFSLALSDLGVGLITQPLGVVFSKDPVEMEKTWVKPTFQMFSGSLAAVSLLTITAISVERYLALKLHLRHQELVTVKRVFYVLVLIWTCCIVAASSLFWYDHILFYRAAVPAIAVCLLINIFVYQKLYRVCRVHHVRICDQATFQDAQLHQRAIAEARFRKSVKTIFFILLALIICYLPFCCFTVAVVVVARDIGNMGDDLYALLFSCYLYTWTIVFANSTVNPLLLYFQLTELRSTIKRLAKKLCRCRNKSNDLGRSTNLKTQLPLPATFRVTTD
ncbi:melanocortin receptor 3-like [Oculina patagonica]